MDSVSNRSFFNISTFTLISALLLSVAMSLLSVAHATSWRPPPGEVTGYNLKFATVVNKVNQYTDFVQTRGKKWVEKNSADRVIHTYTETNRDASSVYLKDHSRKLRLELNLQNKTLFVYNHWKFGSTKRDIGLIHHSFLVVPPKIQPAPVSPSEACRRAGGEMKSGMGVGNIFCVKPAKDAGKRCTDSSQCEGRCDYKPLVPGGTSEVIGQCQVTIPSSNCYQEMRAGRVGPKICP